RNNRVWKPISFGHSKFAGSLAEFRGQSVYFASDLVWTEECGSNIAIDINGRAVLAVQNRIGRNDLAAFGHFRRFFVTPRKAREFVARSAVILLVCFTLETNLSAKSQTVDYVNRW